ncbi:carbohydrate-binding module family 18 protein, partial [Aulographum hederae CBS 113979]
MTLVLTSSPDRTCGKDVVFSCLGSIYGACCSQYNSCGSTLEYCGSGCQEGFGLC